MPVLRRTATVAGVLLAVLAAFVSGFLVAHGRPGPTTPVRLTGQGLGSGMSCASLRQWYVDHALSRVTPYGWNEPMVPYAGSVAAPEAAGPGTASGSRSLDTTTTSRTGTNVQEAGVDEPDLAKTQGSLLVRIADEILTTYDVSGRAPRELGSVPVLGTSGGQLLLVGDRVVVIGSDAIVGPAGSVPSAAGTRVEIFDVSDPAHPRLVDNRSYGASLVAARQTGNVVHLVLSTGLPTLPFVAPGNGRSTAQALAANKDVVRRSTLADWLPTVTADGVGRQAVACTAVAVPRTFGGLGTLTVVGLDPTSPGAAEVTGVATASDTAYVAPGHLYVAAGSSPIGCCGLPVAGRIPVPATELYAFDLAGTSARYVGTGAVRGTVAGTWSMDEYRGVLRLAVQASYGASSTSVVELRPEAGRLVEVGRLDGLGVGQQLRSVRWFDDTAVLVTAEQVDPFYVLDLADPAHPQAVGVLHLPGWSSYLHPVGPHLVLGLGQTAPTSPVLPIVPRPSTVKPMPGPTTGPQPQKGAPSAPAGSGWSGSPVPLPSSITITARPEPVLPVARGKATLFDVADLSHPRVRGTVRFPVGSTVGADPHQVTWLPDRHTLLAVVSSYDGRRAWIAVLDVASATLRERLVPVAPGAAVGNIRTLPVAGGRVALVTDAGVRFVPV